MFLEKLPQECIPEESTETRKVNNTPAQSWVRFPDEESSKRFLLTLQSKSSPARDLDLTAAPVFQLCNALGKGLISPLPNILIVKPTPKYRESANTDALDKAFKKLGLVHHPRVTKYLGGYRYYSLSRKVNTKDHLPTAYKFVLDFTSKSGETYKAFKNYVEGVLLDYVPLFVPTATTSINLSDPYFNKTTGTQSNLTQIAAEDGWEIAWGQNGTPFEAGKGVVVAVIDSGVDLQHEDLEGAFVQGATFKPGAGWNNETGIGPVIIDEDPDTGGLVPDGDDPHGTCCAGIIAARCNNGKGIAGLAGACKIMPIRLSTHAISTVACAINYAVHEDRGANSADVISMSFGRDKNRGDYLNHELVDTALNNAYANGVVLCAATMNSGEDKIYYPAAHQYVIACGACDTTGARAGYSNGGKELTVVAPGNGITTTTMRSRGDNNSDYTTSFGGTSAATPHVAGLAALLISKHPKLRDEPDTICQIITTSADETRNGNNRNTDVGHGRINVKAAFEEAARRL